MLRNKIIAAAFVVSSSGSAAFAVDPAALQQGPLLDGGSGCLGTYCNELNAGFVADLTGVIAPVPVSGGQAQETVEPVVTRPALTPAALGQQIAGGSLSVAPSADDAEEVLSPLASVPVPATLPLLLGALGLGALLSRRTR